MHIGIEPKPDTYTTTAHEALPQRQVWAQSVASFESSHRVQRVRLHGRASYKP